MNPVKGAIGIKDNMTAVLRGIKKEQQSFRKDVESTRKSLEQAWNKKHTARVDTSAAAKGLDSLKKKLEPLKKKVTTAVAIKDMATDKIKAVGNKVKAVGKMAAKPIIAVKDATVASLSKIKSGLKSIAKTVAIPVTIAGTALLGGAISQGAKLEQSIGGVETLFKESSGVVKANADKAFSTAGLSANDYMETVTSFSASLLNSLGGDTAKSATIADMAIVDMADNANKFGTEMESIQNAYQGFAKQNYTMLDNLKLGYGGTKEEMARLLTDANKLTGIKYDIDNLSDVYSAIHSIQENLGVTGTTAKEASATFSGSFASMKAAASNLLGNLSIGGDVTGSMEQLVDSASTFLFQNAIPMVGRVITALPGAIKTCIAKAGPKIKEAGGAIIQSLKDGMVNILPSSMGGLITPLFDTLGNVGNAFAAIQPQLASFGVSVMETVQQVATAVMPAVNSIINTVQAVIPTVLPVIETVVNTIGQVISAAAPVIEGLVLGISTVIRYLAPVFQMVFDGIGEKVGSVLSFVGEQMGWIQEVINTSMPVIKDILTTAWNVISPVLDIMISIFKILFSVVKAVFPGIMKVVSSVWNFLKPIIEGIGSFFNWIGDKLSSVANFLGGGGGGGSVGNNAEGTNNWRGGPTWVGEEGPELVELPRGTKILPNKESVQYAKGVQNASVGSVSALGQISSAAAPVVQNTIIAAQQSGGGAFGIIARVFDGVRSLFNKLEDKGDPKDNKPNPFRTFPPPPSGAGGFPRPFPQLAPAGGSGRSIIIQKLCDKIEIYSDDDYSTVGEKMVAALRLADANS